MNIQERVDKAVNINDAIEFFNRKKDTLIENLELSQMVGFDRLEKKYKHDIDICNRAISRLHLLYLKTINNL